MAQPWFDTSPLNLPGHVPNLPRDFFRYKLEFLDDHSISPECHVRNFGNILRTLNIRDESSAMCLFTHTFRGPVLEWFHSLPPSSISTWEELKNTFLTMFTSYQDPNLVVQELSRIRRLPSETLPYFNQRFRKHHSQIPEGYLTELCVIGMYEEALDPTIAFYLRREQHHDLSSVMDSAYLIEQQLIATQLINPPAKVVSPTPVYSASASYTTSREPYIQDNSVEANELRKAIQLLNDEIENLKQDASHQEPINEYNPYTSNLVDKFQPDDSMIDLCWDTQNTNPQKTHPWDTLRQSQETSSAYTYPPSTFPEYQNIQSSTLRNLSEPYQPFACPDIYHFTSIDQLHAQNPSSIHSSFTDPGLNYATYPSDPSLVRNDDYPSDFNFPKTHPDFQFEESLFPRGELSILCENLIQSDPSSSPFSSDTNLYLEAHPMNDQSSDSDPHNKLSTQSNQEIIHPYLNDLTVDYDDAPVQLNPVCQPTTGDHHQSCDLNIMVNQNQIGFNECQAVTTESMHDFLSDFDNTLEYSIISDSDSDQQINQVQPLITNPILECDSAFSQHNPTYHSSGDPDQSCDLNFALNHDQIHSSEVHSNCIEKSSEFAYISDNDDKSQCSEVSHKSFQLISDPPDASIQTYDNFFTKGHSDGLEFLIDQSNNEACTGPEPAFVLPLDHDQIKLESHINSHSDDSHPGNHIKLQISLNNPNVLFSGISYDHSEHLPYNDSSNPRSNLFESFNLYEHLIPQIELLPIEFGEGAPITSPNVDVFVTPGGSDLVIYEHLDEIHQSPDYSKYFQIPDSLFFALYPFESLRFDGSSCTCPTGDTSPITLTRSSLFHEMSGCTRRMLSTYLDQSYPIHALVKYLIHFYVP